MCIRDRFKDYLNFAETFVSVPYFQSLSTIPRLRDWIDTDAVFVNGGTGDFISGGHISPVFSNFKNQKSDKERMNKVNEANIENSVDVSSIKLFFHLHSIDGLSIDRWLRLIVFVSIF